MTTKFLEDKQFATATIDEKLFPFKDPTRGELDRTIMSLWHQNEGEWNYHVCITPNNKVFDNNFYLIYVFYQDKLEYYGVYQSHTARPPVWNREFGIEYNDYLKVQEFIRGKTGRFITDYNPEGKMIYLVKQEEIGQDQYTIIGAFAEKFPEEVEKIQAGIYSQSEQGVMYKLDN